MLHMYKCWQAHYNNLDSIWVGNKSHIFILFCNILHAFRHNITYAHNLGLSNEYTFFTCSDAVLGVTRYLCNALHNIITFVVTK